MTRRDRLDVEQGVQIHVHETARTMHTLLVRDGCSGSPACALEVYVAEGHEPFSGLNLHLTEDEARQLRRALDAVHGHRQRAIYAAWAGR